MSHLTQIIEANRSGQAVALPSVCSSHPDVIEASVLLAKELKKPLLIEATSNQVNQFGGYTGMQPRDFVAFVHEIMGRHDFDKDQVIFGGDHLGPQAWKNEDATSAMAKAEEMIRLYVEAGFSKIHLDCSEGCAGEAPNVGDEICAERAARLASICERYAPDPSKLRYVVGTEVPVPGGARIEEDGVGITPTDPQAASTTLATQKAAFEAHGLQSAWEKVIALVVQPGLEFSADHIDAFDCESSNHLSSILAEHPHICFEAHSTDYQKNNVYPALADRNFAILKVGPALTFAWREALYALGHIRKWLMGEQESLDISAAMDQLMQGKPSYWQGHYEGSALDLKLLRHFGYADRIRYYWTLPEAQKVVADLLSDLQNRTIPAPLLTQYFPPETCARADDLRALGLSQARALLLAHVQIMLRPYYESA